MMNLERYFDIHYSLFVIQEFIGGDEIA